MQEIPLCRFVNKRIDLEPKFNIFEYSSIIRKVFRQIRTNYLLLLKKTASWRVYFSLVRLAAVEFSFWYWACFWFRIDYLLPFPLVDYLCSEETSGRVMSNDTYAGLLVLPHLLFPDNLMKTVCWLLLFCSLHSFWQDLYS